MSDDWDAARGALDAAAAEGRTVHIWLRDDDCVAPTPALERLVALCDAVSLPILLAVIPEPAEAGLAPWLAAHPSVTFCQHGLAHRNHALSGERARELGGRSVAAVLDDLARGRERMRDLFGGALADVLVPPWNRIDDAVIPHLASAGYSALSCFAPTPDPSPLPRLDCDLDIVDWRGGRVGRPLGDLAGKVAGIVARQDRLGILTHHLAHDDAAWTALGAMLDGLAAHRAVRFSHARSLLGVERSQSLFE